MQESLKNRLDNSPYIRAKQQDNGLVAYNFTRKAFWGNNWDAQTITARGLFMDGETIVGRGYRKFFNINQPHGYTTEQVTNEFTRPIRITTKRNGFLGIMFAHNGELLLWSKGGDTDYSREAKRFLDSTNVNQDAILKFLESNNVSLTWEIVLPQDPHVIEEPRFGMYLLDAIENTEEGKIVSEELLVKENGIFIQTEDWGLDSYWNLKDPANKNKPIVMGYHQCIFDAEYVSILFNADTNPMSFIQNKNPYCEGYVLRDADGRMTKVKQDYYQQLKSLRGPLRNALSGKPAKREYTLPEWFPTEILEGTPEEVRERLEDCLVTNLNGAQEVSLPLLDKKYGLSDRATKKLNHGTSQQEKGTPPIEGARRDT